MNNMKKIPIKSIIRTFFSKQSKNFSLFQRSFLVFGNGNKLSLNKCTKFKFSSKDNEEESHSDFSPKVKQEITDDNVMKTIDDIVKNNNVVLFMKGTRQMPRCGFSNYTVQILNFYKIKDVKIVNILENQILREAVKQYSNWPTFPQLYVKGNLVGGCDIIKEMHDLGTFKELVEREGIASNE
jgi:monothiol glutaredoxin